jgi:uncharacterized NAD(P)/FAD-binding protein YdhS
MADKHKAQSHPSSKNERPMSVDFKDIVVIGGGFSGTVLAVHLLRQSVAGRSLAVMDEGTVPARGLAYGTTYACHLLNVQAGEMSAFPDDPEHFLNWAQRNCSGIVEPQSFLPRASYGEYLGSLLEGIQTRERAAGTEFAWIRDTAVSVENSPDEFVIHRRNGPPVVASIVVLALGNFPPGNAPFRGLESRRVLPAWSKNSLAGLSDDDVVLLIGSGLTSVDVTLALHADGFHGKIQLLSRHGLLPLCHQLTPPWPRFYPERSARTVLGLWRLIRKEVASAAATGVDWRAVIDSLRPSLQTMWQSLSLNERRRFLRHARAYWEVHRHRIAPAVARTFSNLMKEGRVEILAGRILSCRENFNAIEVSFRKRETGTTQTLRATRVINCSGPETDYRKAGGPLLASLFEQNLVRQDALALGLDVDEDGAVLDSSGRASQRLFAIGPVCKGRLWESTAVPELRVQAANLASCLLKRKLRRSRSVSRRREILPVR